MLSRFHSYPNIYVSDVTLKIENLERSLTFYEKVIGFSIMERNESEAILTVDGKTPLLKLIQLERVERKTYPTTGLYHFALLLPSRNHLANIIQHLLNNHIELQASDHLVSEAIYLNDPDGNGIEIYADRPYDSWEWHNGEVKMTVDPLNYPSLVEIGDADNWRGLPSETVMGHIHLQVSDLEASRQFYVEGLGFDIVNYMGRKALFISSAGYHHHIGLNVWAGTGIPDEKEKHVGMKYFSIQFPTYEERQNVVERLKHFNIKIDKKEECLIVKDPANITIYLAVTKK